MAKTDPYARRTWRNHKFDNRTVSALQWAEKRYLRRAPLLRKHWVIAQGSYNVGVDASAGSHDGGGTVDISVANMNSKQIRATVKWLRKAGFAAWFRNWPGNQHIHAVLLGHRTASPLAKYQMQAYLNHRDGLAGNAYDPFWRPRPQVRWSHKQGRPVRL
jgi:hypothetical protein